MTRDFGDQVFAGAASYYAKYRPSYPQKLFEDIVHEFGLDGAGKMLDLGCGTGELAIPLAKYFQNVLAVDPDSDMMVEGQNKAQSKEITNISWQKGSSKELSSFGRGFRLVTMGQSFHWMEQEKILEELYNSLIEPGGGLAIIGTEPVKQGSLAANKEAIVKRLITKYLGPERRAGAGSYTAPPKRYEELLPNSKFKNFEQHYYDVILERDVDEIVGHIFSMSWALKSHFANRVEDFENELRHGLEAISEDGKVIENIRFSLYTLVK